MAVCFSFCHVCVIPWLRTLFLCLKPKRCGSDSAAIVVTLAYMYSCHHPPVLSFLVVLRHFGVMVSKLGSSICQHPFLQPCNQFFLVQKKSISLLYYFKIPSPCSAMNHNPTSLGAPCGEQCIPGLKDETHIFC